MNTLNRKNRFSAILFLLVLFGAWGADAQKRSDIPAWVSYYSRQSQYPTSTYVIGFSSEKINGYETVDEMFERLKNHARLQLIESIYVEIKSITTSSTVIQDENTAEEFKKTSVSLSKVKIAGLTEETYYDEKEKICYAFTYARKSEVSALHRNLIVTKKSEIENNIREAESYEAARNNQSALKAYYLCQPLFREVEEAQTLIMAFENRNVDYPDLYFSDINKSKEKVNAGINRIQKSDNLNFEDLCFVLANSIKLQTGQLQKKVIFNNITYQDSKMASAFSKRFADLFEMKLSNEGISVQRNISDVNKKLTNVIMLSGTYWVSGDNIQVIMIMRDMDSGETLASSQAFTKKAWYEANGIQYVPANYNDIISDYNQFYSNDIVSEGGLYVDVTTNRGNDNPIYTNGDTLAISVKANRECYIRVIYHFADGNKVLFFDNYYISPDMVNRYIEIPFKFECIEPFGIETLQMNAQTVKFEALNIKEQYGNKFIVDELEDILAKTRGFKPIENKDAKAEKRVVVTTLAY